MMNLFRGSIDFAAIKKEYETQLNKLNPDTITKIKGGTGNPLAFFNTRFYRLFTASMFKAFHALEKGKSQQYYKYLNQSSGDYSKRKGGNVQAQMISHAEFIADFIKKSNNENLRYSLLGIFTDIWAILKDARWVAAFKKAFSHVEKTGETNSIVSSFKMMYLALVIAFESAGIKMLSFEYDVYTGIDPEKSISNIMQTHSSFMKSVIFPVIRIICICKNIKNPLDTVNNLIKDENTVKTAKKNANESGYTYNPEENGLTSIEAFRIEQINRSTEDTSLLRNIVSIIPAFFGLTGASAGVVAAGTASLPLTGAIMTFTVVIILLIIAIPVARLIIYYINIKKVDLQKELEMQAELLNNNILQLQEKLEKTSNEDERVRLQNIINKQIEMLVDLQGKIKKYIDEEYEASVYAQQEADSDDNVQTKGDDDANDGGFEVSI
jgi:hypothetical protein